jgi:hypothetical protein
MALETLLYLKAMHMVDEEAYLFQDSQLQRSQVLFHFGHPERVNSFPPSLPLLSAPLLSPPLPTIAVEL